MKPRPKHAVYIVSGLNWTASVTVDKLTSQFEEKFQILEVATQCVESCCGLKSTPQLRLLHGNKPALDTLLLVTLRGDKPGRCAMIYTWVCCANAGLHHEASRLQKVWESQAPKM